MVSGSLSSYTLFGIHTTNRFVKQFSGQGLHVLFRLTVVFEADQSYT